MNFKKIKVMWISSAGLLDCQPSIGPSCASCRALKITQNNRLLRLIYETVVQKTIFLLRHGDTTVEEQTSYTITGLTLDTVYTIIVTACNMCGCGPVFITSVSLSTVTASTNPVIITSIVNPVSIIENATTTTTTTTTTATITASAITTTNPMTAAVSRDTVNTIKATTSLTVPSSNLGTTIITTTTTVIKCFGMYVSIVTTYTATI